MKKIEWFWNIVYYNVYIFDSKCRKLFNYLNPFYLINKIPAVKKHHAKHGVDDMNKFAERILNNPKSGISSIWSGSFMGGLLVFIGIGLLNIIETIVGRSLIRDVTNSSSHFIIFPRWRGYTFGENASLSCDPCRYKVPISPRWRGFVIRAGIIPPLARACSACVFAQPVCHYHIKTRNRRRLLACEQRKNRVSLTKIRWNTA
jgi:hypothetical protein